MTNTTSPRNPTSVPVTDVISDRWSPTSFDPAHVVTRDDLVALAEAARWAPSGGNGQPWKFLVAARGTEAYDSIQAALGSWNKEWSVRGSAVGVALVDVSHDAEDASSAPDPRARFYDVGLAVGSLILEAENRGLHAHQVAGTDEDAIRASFGVGDGYAVAAAFVIGALDGSDDAPAALRERDGAPRQRRPLDDVADIFA